MSRKGLVQSLSIPQTVITMTTAEIISALALIRQETDLNAKALLLAALVSELSRVRGFEPVVVGGSAIVVHTDRAGCPWRIAPVSPVISFIATAFHSSPGVRSAAAAGVK